MHVAAGHLQVCTAAVLATCKLHKTSPVTQQPPPDITCVTTDQRLSTARALQLERNSEPRTNPASATRPEDIAYVQELVSSVQAWMAEGTTDSLELELSFNGFLRMLAYQELEKAQFGVEGHPGFYVDRNKTVRNFVWDYVIACSHCGNSCIFYALIHFIL